MTIVNFVISGSNASRKERHYTSCKIKPYETELIRRYIRYIYKACSPLKKTKPLAQWMHHTSSEPLLNHNLQFRKAVSLTWFWFCTRFFLMILRLYIEPRVTSYLSLMRLSYCSPTETEIIFCTMFENRLVSSCIPTRIYSKDSYRRHIHLQAKFSLQVLWQFSLQQD